MTTLEKLTGEILKDLNRERWAVRSHNALYRALVRMTGKKIIGKREERKLIDFYLAELACSDKLRVSVEAPITGRMGQFYLDVTNETKGEHVRHFLGYYDDVGAYDPAIFEKRDVPNGEAAMARNAEREALLESGTLISLAKMIDKHNECYRVVQSLTEHGSFGFQAHYIAGRMLEGTEDHERAVREARK